MATYTLTIDFNQIQFDTNNITHYYNDLANTNQDQNPYQSIGQVTSAIDSYYVGEFGGTGTWTNVNDLYTYTFNPDVNPSSVDGKELVAIVITFVIDEEFIFQYAYAWQVGEPDTTPCPNCQPLAITNCGPVEISLPLPDDDYTVTLYDNQSGVSYEQNVQWTAGTGTWNTTNTAGVFTPFNIFTLTVTDSSGEPVSWPVGPNEYTCARVTFSATVDTNVND